MSSVNPQLRHYIPNVLVMQSEPESRSALPCPRGLWVRENLPNDQTMWSLWQV